jgi:cation/acetate symporter
MPDTQSRFRRRLMLYYGLFTLGLFGFVGMMGLLEHSNADALWLGYVFLFVTIAIYACIGLICRTSDLNEYYVAGRRVPAMFNGMAIAADWMSAASFIGLAGIIFVSGYEGLAYVMGWTGGYCLVPSCWRHTCASTAATRSRFWRRGTATASRAATCRCAIAVLAASLCSFVYLVAQIQGVGLIVTRFIGVEFAVGVFFGLAGILVCSFLGGMRAVTWTQVAQYIMLIVAFLLTVSLIAWKHHHSAAAGQLWQVAESDRPDGKAIERDPAEIQVREIFQQQAIALQDRIARLPESFSRNATRSTRLLELRRAMPLREIKAWSASAWHSGRCRGRAAAVDPDARGRAGAQPAFDAVDRTISCGIGAGAQDAAAQLRAAGVLPDGRHRQPAAHPDAALHDAVGHGDAQLGGLGGVLHCAALRVGATLAALVKVEFLQHLVGTPYAELPQWVVQWRKVDPPVFGIRDMNADGIVWAEILIQPDMIVLAAPEIAGLPYVISGLVAAGALAARCRPPTACCHHRQRAVARRLLSHDRPPRATSAA